MFWTLLVWILYGSIVGVLARAFHPGKEDMGIIATILIGIAGSYLGGFLNWVLGFGSAPFAPAGIIMGVTGAVLLFYAYYWFKPKNVG